jgi:hypothetical protein
MVTVDNIMKTLRMLYQKKGTLPVTARSKAWVCGRSLPGIVGSNPACGMDIYLL